MEWVRSLVRNAIYGLENKLLAIRFFAKFSASSKNDLTAIHTHSSSTENYDESTNMLVQDQASSGRTSSCFSAYTSNYSGSTCLFRNVSLNSCSKCRCSNCSIIELSKAILGCFLNLLCYPFIPCAVAFLPTSFHFAGYSNANSLYPCYSKSCCFCIKSSDSSSVGICCSPLCCLLVLSFLIVFAFFVLFDQSEASLYVIDILLYFEDLNEVASVFIFVLGFTLVAFPVMWGYVLFNLVAGYLYGFWWGLLVVVFSVSIGLTIAYIVCKKYFSSCVMNLLRKRSNFEQIEAILQVINGSSGLKVIALTRLTPIPFGFQNGMFSVSNVSLKYYLLASNVGLLPTQVFYCYIASKFRSIDQIADQKNPNGYLLFFLQVFIGVILTMFVVQRARRELAVSLQNAKKPDTDALLTNQVADDVSNDDHNKDELMEIKCTQPTSTSSSLHPERKPIVVI